MTDSIATWPAPAARQPVRARVCVPGSKSLTNRYAVLAALADGPSTLRGALRSRDTELMFAALTALGADITDDAGALRFTPLPAAGVNDRRTADIDCGLAGTIMRFVPFTAAAAGRSARFDGDPEARVRPMGTVLTALRDLGVSVDAERDALPFTLTCAGTPRGGALTIDASRSSQFVSGLLLAAPRFAEGLTLTHSGPHLPSVPHIDMTLEVLRARGVTVEHPTEHVWRVAPGPIRAFDAEVEPDLSNAAAFLGAALATGGTVAIPHWPAETTQAGDAFRAIAEAFGADVALTGGELTVTGPARLRPVSLDLSPVGELTPVTAAVAALAEGTSRLTGIGHLRGHETDRLRALATELAKVGAHVEEGPDSLTITGPTTGRDVLWDTYADHRMVMAGAIIGLAVPGVRIADPGTVGKTLPEFTRMWDEAFG